MAVMGMTTSLAATAMTPFMEIMVPISLKVRGAMTCSMAVMMRNTISLAVMATIPFTVVMAMID